jgi:hypothetical protein
VHARDLPVAVAPAGLRAVAQVAGPGRREGPAEDLLHLVRRRQAPAVEGLGDELRLPIPGDLSAQRAHHVGQDPAADGAGGGEHRQKIGKGAPRRRARGAPRRVRRPLAPLRAPRPRWPPAGPSRHPSPQPRQACEERHGSAAGGAEQHNLPGRAGGGGTSAVSWTTVPGGVLGDRVVRPRQHRPRSLRMLTVTDNRRDLLGVTAFLKKRFQKTVGRMKKAVVSIDKCFQRA